MRARRESRCVILPSYNSGGLLALTTSDALAAWPDVTVVIDGSTDGSASCLEELAGAAPGLHVMNLGRNHGKGGAVLEAMASAWDRGFTHALVMDADGQHPADRIPAFMELSLRHPEALILGVPAFGPDAPSERVLGRRVGNFFANLETLWGGIGDSLFGFRLYPLKAAREAMAGTRYGRRFDFDTEIAVRLFWAGVRPVCQAVPVYYPPRESGGITHFRYVRDNFLLVQTHARLTLLALPRLLRVWKLQKKWRSLPPPC